MKHHLLTAAILLAALALYGAGLDGGGMALILAGCLMEGWFWMRALRGQAKPPR